MAIGKNGEFSHSVSEAPSEQSQHVTKLKVKWYRSTLYNAIILGICNFCAPGIWGAMNSLGGGGQQDPWLVNAANALTFCLMVVTCAFSGVFVKYLGIRWTLILGAAGYCPYAAGLYCNNRFGSSWFVLFGAATCGLGAGLFWMAEAAIALSYPEPYNQGKLLGLWLSFRVGGQILGGAVNLGLNVDRSEAGSVSYSVFQVFIALQAVAPFAGLLLTAPSKVERTDGQTVSCSISKDESSIKELVTTAKLFAGKNFLLIVPLISQAVFAEAVFFTYQGLWFSVRARALGSFLSGIVAIAAGNLLGLFLDNNKLMIRLRARGSFAVIMTLQGAWWIWGTILVTDYHRTQPTIDWVDVGFGRGFAWFLFMVMGFQVNYMYLYFVIGQLAKSDAEIIRYAGLLRGTESAAQAVSYGLTSVSIMGQVGAVYLNFALYAVSIIPAWFVIKEIGVSLGPLRDDKKVDNARAVEE
ncbi:Putative Ion channel regulatory protein, UNC-93 [Septoria linicola]|uniref:Ion channel regulatory protein, UNC-93 n=1 Tax=Septoria linicola TaxID=215465 RepID=A0A9Q9AWP6_9PEZI|nr:putative Ion channel regulatory protein, UNC-93 [Septoria linicola]USW56379.1 Putative Ion channel regulatory protein, UNC-93 [Septoria linicola]